MSELRTIKKVGDEAQQLAELVDHPSWQMLRRIWKERQETGIKRLANEMLAGGEDAGTLDQRKIDYRRGFIRGATAVLDSPENALRELEAALAKEERQK